APGRGQVPGHPGEPVHGEHVGHDDAVEAVPLAQQAGEQLVVGAAGNAVDVVVGGHEGDRSGLEACEHGRQVDLGEIVGADVGGLSVAASDRLPLCGEMLEDDADAL